MDVDLIPRSKIRQCPTNTQYKDGLGTCICEDHCGWDLCRLTVPPEDCISGTHGKWQWDKVKRAWVAQITLGDFASKAIQFYKILFVELHFKPIFFCVFFIDPYEYFGGCKDVDRNGHCREEGKRCGSNSECTDCTLGKCIQLAKEKYSEGFSYLMKSDGASYCSLCTIEQLDSLQTDAFWTVYKKPGNVLMDLVISSLCFLSRESFLS